MALKTDLVAYPYTLRGGRSGLTRGHGNERVSSIRYSPGRSLHCASVVYSRGYRFSLTSTRISQHILTRQKRPFVLISKFVPGLRMCQSVATKQGTEYGNRNFETLLELAIGSCAESRALIPVAQTHFVRTLGNCSMWLGG